MTGVFVLIFAGVILAVGFGFQAVEADCHRYKVRLNNILLRRWLRCNALVVTFILSATLVVGWQGAQQNPNLTRLGRVAMTGFFAIIVAAACWVAFAAIFCAMLKYTRMRTVRRLKDRKRTALRYAASRASSSVRAIGDRVSRNPIALPDTTRADDPDDEILDPNDAEDLPEDEIAGLGVAQLIRETASVLRPAGVRELFPEPEPEAEEAEVSQATVPADEGPAAISVVHDNIIMYPELQVVDVRRRHRRRRTS